MLGFAVTQSCSSRKHQTRKLLCSVTQSHSIVLGQMDECMAFCGQTNKMLMTSSTQTTGMMILIIEKTKQQQQQNQHTHTHTHARTHARTHTQKPTQKTTTNKQTTKTVHQQQQNREQLSCCQMTMTILTLVVIFPSVSLPRLRPSLWVWRRCCSC